MAATVKELATEVTELRQALNQVSMTVDTHWASYQADLLTLRQEIKSYFKSANQVGETHPASDNKRTEPWRLPLEEFVAMKNDIKPDWSDAGNAKTGQRLAKYLRRSSGHTEGELYIRWCGKVGRPAVKAFWLSRGFSEVPEGL